jgi:dTDP-glucose 4,6-dehydratase
MVDHGIVAGNEPRKGDDNQTILVTGGAGFIGSNLIKILLDRSLGRVINVDKLSYAGDLESTQAFVNNPNFIFEQVDIVDANVVNELFSKYAPTYVMHLAAESHVDRSITNASEFIRSNIFGTYTLLEATRSYYQSLTNKQQENFRFLHVSTDEVYGHLGKEGYFSEHTPYNPSSPYSASKAASDHLARAWHRTYGLPIIVTNCSNNYGPWQFPEKLIPVIIMKALAGEPIPIYGKGENVRDWLHVTDHCDALISVIQKGKIGETYLIGGHGERTNLAVARTICSILNDEAPNPKIGDYGSLIKFVTDRPGHDFRYAINPEKISTEIGWRAKYTFDEGLRETVKWYMAHKPWCERLLHKGK